MKLIRGGAKEPCEASSGAPPEAKSIHHSFRKSRVIACQHRQSSAPGDAAVHRTGAFAK